MKMNTVNMLGITLLGLIILLIVTRRSMEGYEDLKIDANTMKMAQNLIKETNTAGDANESFRKVLAFIENNPGGATNWLAFIKLNFFEPGAKFRENSSFEGISDRWRPLFKDPAPEPILKGGLIGMPKK
jgi:hypothetical protein